LSFEIQELQDLIRIIVLENPRKEVTVQKSSLKNQLDKVYTGYACVEMRDLEKTLSDMVSEGLIHDDRGTLHLTEQGLKLGKEWASLLLKKKPILEVAASLVNGSITGLVGILSAFFAGLAMKTALFAAFLILSFVSITNFSSFFTRRNNRGSLGHDKSSNLDELQSERYS